MTFKKEKQDALTEIAKAMGYESIGELHEHKLHISSPLKVNWFQALWYRVWFTIWLKRQIRKLAKDNQ